MNPVIIIPSYWSARGKEAGLQKPGDYDHATPLDAAKPELYRCLQSLCGIQGLGRIIVLVVAESSIESQVEARIAKMREELGLDLYIISSRHVRLMQEYLADELDNAPGEIISLRGYGSIRNMGLLAAAAFGHDVAVFLDDDEKVLDQDFLLRAVYGLGQKTRQGLPIVAKSGFFLDKRNSCYADLRQVRWCDKHWAKRTEFNELMNNMQSGARISRSNILCGGCFALHAEAYMRVAFDPWITRGEDEDYLINLRLYGLDVWFDNKWSVKHLPPANKKQAPRFMQNVYRWVYEMKKLEYAHTKIDLQAVTPASLMPYPGPWVGAELKERVQKTAFLRALGTPERSEYFKIFLHGWKSALEYAEENCDKYLNLQAVWPQFMASCWENATLRHILEGKIQDGQLLDLQQTSPQLYPVNFEVPTDQADVAQAGTAQQDFAQQGGAQVDLSQQDSMRLTQEDDLRC